MTSVPVTLSNTFFILINHFRQFCFVYSVLQPEVE